MSSNLNLSSGGLESEREELSQARSRPGFPLSFSSQLQAGGSCYLPDTAAAAALEAQLPPASPAHPGWPGRELGSVASANSHALGARDTARCPHCILPLHPPRAHLILPRVLAASPSRDRSWQDSPKGAGSLRLPMPGVSLLPEWAQLPFWESQEGLSCFFPMGWKDGRTQH